MTTKMTDAIINQLQENCKFAIESGDVQGAYGCMTDLLKHHMLQKKHLPTDIEELYAILLISDAMEAAL